MKQIKYKAMKHCQRCPAMFLPACNRQSYCSVACRNANQVAVRREVRRAISAQKIPIPLTHADRVMGKIPHGTLNGYDHFVCRCAKCKKAYAAWKASRFATNDHSYAMRRARRSRDLAAERGAKIDPTFDLRELAEILLNANCAVCPLEIETSLRDKDGKKIDHIVPIALGGEHTFSNVQILCKAHHRAKTLAERNTSKRPGTSSRFRGVSWHKSAGKWRAQIRAGDVQHWLGDFTSEVAAAIAYNNAAKQLFGEFAYPNDVGTQSDYTLAA